MLGLGLRPGDGVTAVEFSRPDGLSWVEPVPAAELLREAKLAQPKLWHGSFACRERGLEIALASLMQSGFTTPVVCGSLYLAGDMLRLAGR